jgi:Immunity protein 7
MHEFHAWIGLAESTFEDDDVKLASAIEELQQIIAEKSRHDAKFDIKNLSGRHFLTATGFVSRRREEGDKLELLLSWITRRLPGSWGLVYERDDEMTSPPGPNAFRVRVVARGIVQERLDTYLSPCMPVIED